MAGSFVIACQCGKHLNIPADKEGTKVRCPGCKAVITAARPAPAKVTIYREEDLLAEEEARKQEQRAIEKERKEIEREKRQLENERQRLERERLEGQRLERERLEREEQVRVPSQVGPVAPANSGSPLLEGKGPYFVCPNPNCGFAGKSLIERQGSGLVCLVLSLFFVLPGLLYGMFCIGYKYRCPCCQMVLDKDRCSAIELVIWVILAFLIIVLAVPVLMRPRMIDIGTAG